MLYAVEKEEILTLRWYFYMHLQLTKTNIHSVYVVICYIGANNHHGSHEIRFTFSS